MAPECPGPTSSIEDYQLNFNPSWMLRGPPVPITGFAAATSGVEFDKPNTPPRPRSLVNKIAGFANSGWLSILKNSPRSCALARSPKRNDFTIEKSQLWKPEARNVFRPRLPNVPGAGGVRIPDP